MTVNWLRCGPRARRDRRPEMLISAYQASDAASQITSSAPSAGSVTAIARARRAATTLAQWIRRYISGDDRGPLLVAGVFEE